MPKHQRVGPTRRDPEKAKGPTVKVISTRVTDEMYAALVELANEKQTSVSQVLASAVQGLIQGKIPLRTPGGQDICPRCGQSLHVLEGPKNKLYFWCWRCGWVAYLGIFEMPQHIEDWTKK